MPLTSHESDAVRRAVVDWSAARPDAEARVIHSGGARAPSAGGGALAYPGVLAAVVHGRRSLTVEFVEPVSREDVWRTLDFAAGRLAGRCASGPAGTGEG